MKTLAWLIGLAGILVAALAVFGRFCNAPTISFGGHSFAASTFLLVANTLLLIAVFFTVCAHGKRSD